MKLLRRTYIQFCLGVLIGILFTAGISVTAKSEDRFVPAVIEGKSKWLFPGWESLTTADTAKVDQCINLIRQARDELAAKKIELLVLVVPMKAAVYPDYLPEDYPISREILSRYDYILSRTSLAGIVISDLRQTFLRMAADRRNAFYRTDYHWTASASEAAAVLVATEIRQRWKLVGKAHTGMKIGSWVDETRYGDLANLLPNDRRKEIGEEVFTVRKNPAQGNLLDEGANPIRIVGNSFVQPYLGFSQRLSHEVDRPVGLTWNFGNIGPWSTFLQFLRSPEFKTQRPQVIVWQFNEGQFMNGPDAIGQWDAPAIVTPSAWLEQVRARLEVR